MLTRYLNLCTRSQFEQKQNFDFSSPKRQHWCNHLLIDQHHFIFNAFLDWIGIIDRLSPDQQVGIRFRSLVFIQRYAEYLAYGLLSVFIPLHPSTFDRAVRLCLVAHRVLCDGVPFDRSMTDRTAPSSSQAIDHLLPREGQKMMAVNTYLEELFQDRDRTDALLQKLNYRKIGQDIQTVFHEVSVLGDDIEKLKEEVDKEYNRLDMDAWLQYG